MKFPLRISVTTAFALFSAFTISLVATLDYLGSREAILDNAKVSISKAAESAEQGVNDLVGQSNAARVAVHTGPVA